jgi:hypothetical protein
MTAVNLNLENDYEANERAVLVFHFVRTLRWMFDRCPGEKPEGQGGEISKLVGDWFGESICVNKEKFPACHDEQVVYHVAVASGKTNTVTIAADKIVNGKPEAMGTFDFTYDAQKRTLTSEINNERMHLIFEFAVKDELLEGTLSRLPERTLARRIKVKKSKT